MPLSTIARTEIALDAEELVNRLVQWLKDRQVIVYAVVHHTKDMQARGVDPHMDAWTVIYGNPVFGAAFLQDAPTAVVDIPMRVGFYQKQKGKSVIVRRRMEELLREHDQADLILKARKADGLLNEWLETIAVSLE